MSNIEKIKQIEHELDYLQNQMKIQYDLIMRNEAEKDPLLYEICRDEYRSLEKKLEHLQKEYEKTLQNQ